MEFDDAAKRREYWTTHTNSRDDDTIPVGRAISTKRRYPVYLILDCSKSMAGEPIDAVRWGLETFQSQIVGDPEASSRVHVGIIQMSSKAHYLNQGLEPIRNFHPPPLEARGKTAYGLALDLLLEKIDRDVVPTVADQSIGDHKPLVFLMTDGKPTDEDWLNSVARVRERVKNRQMQFVTVGCGADVDFQTLREMAPQPEHCFHIADVKNGKAFRDFFKWVSDAVVSNSRSFDKAGEQPGPIYGSPASDGFRRVI